MTRLEHTRHPDAREGDGNDPAALYCMDFHPLPDSGQQTTGSISASRRLTVIHDG
jgi:hypothetical protein